jgi:hypothetical protein
MPIAHLMGSDRRVADGVEFVGETLVGEPPVGEHFAHQERC